MDGRLGLHYNLNIAHIILRNTRAFMYELPLFPLNTVLFPGMPISLHIFEPRYKLMVEECIQTAQPFGVVLIREGVEAFGPAAEPYQIGCSAQITQVERLDDGRMNIVAVGVERFQIHSLSHAKPYLVGTVESLPLDHDDTSAVARAGEQLRPWVERYLTTLSEATDEEASFEPQQLPDDPLVLGYLAATVVQIPLDQKQTLLATNRAADLLTTIRTIYRHELPLLDAMIRFEANNDKALIFSRN
jgi:Lon protease-like protein